jgi:hypothetical protein
MLLAERFSNIGLQPLESWHRGSSTKTRIIILITMAAEDPLFDKLQLTKDSNFLHQSRTFGGSLTLGRERSVAYTALLREIRQGGSYPKTLCPYLTAAVCEPA